jgi:hypothetical protein
METPTIISNHQFTDLDVVNIVLDAIIADDIITLEEYRQLQAQFKSIYPRLIQHFHCTPQEFLKRFGEQEEVYLEDLEFVLVSGSSIALLVNEVQAQILT